MKKYREISTLLCFLGISACAAPLTLDQQPLPSDSSAVIESSLDQAVPLPPPAETAHSSISANAQNPESASTQTLVFNQQNSSRDNQQEQSRLQASQLSPEKIETQTNILPGSKGERILPGSKGERLSIERLAFRVLLPAYFYNANLRIQMTVEALDFKGWQVRVNGETYPLQLRGQSLQSDQVQFEFEVESLNIPFQSFLNLEMLSPNQEVQLALLSQGEALSSETKLQQAVSPTSTAKWQLAQSFVSAQGKTLAEYNAEDDAEVSASKEQLVLLEKNVIQDLERETGVMPPDSASNQEDNDAPERDNSYLSLKNILSSEKTIRLATE